MHKTSAYYCRSPGCWVALMELAVCCQCPKSFLAAPSPPCFLPAEEPKSSCHIQWLFRDYSEPWLSCSHTLNFENTESLLCQSRVLGKQPRSCKEVFMELQQRIQNPAKYECSLIWGKGGYWANRWIFHKCQFRALSFCFCFISVEVKTLTNNSSGFLFSRAPQK